MDENQIGKQVVDAAIAVHRELGPGLLETVYEVVLPNDKYRFQSYVVASGSMRGSGQTSSLRVK